MRRRNFVTLLCGAAAARAQQAGKIPRIGVLWHAGSAKEEEDYLPVLTKAFNDLGYVEGKTIELQHRFPAERPDRFRTLARELVESRVDAIIAVTSMGARRPNKLPVQFP
jgi:putative ABC transport system substrate-binding protein